MSYRPHAYAEVDPTSPRAFGICDRCGALWNHWTLTKEYQWAGTQLVDTGNLACPECFNPPSPFLKTIVLPPDPTPIRNARVEPYGDDEDNDISTETPQPIETENDLNLITE